MNMTPCSLACGGHQGEWWRWRNWDRILRLTRAHASDSHGAPWARQGAQGRRSRALRPTSRRCRNGRPLGRVGAEMGAVSALSVQKCEGLGPPRCIHAACFAPSERGMPHGEFVTIRRKCANSWRLRAVLRSRRCIRSANLGPKHAAEMPLGARSARACPPLRAQLSSSRPMEERRTLNLRPHGHPESATFPRHQRPLERWRVESGASDAERENKPLPVDEGGLRPAPSGSAGRS